MKLSSFIGNCSFLPELFPVGKFYYYEPIFMYAAEGSKEIKWLILLLPLLKKACPSISDESSKIQRQTLTAQNCFLTEHQINQFLNLKWYTLYSSRKEKKEVRMKMLISSLISKLLQLHPW